jgi:hypothetical protein
MLSKGPNREFTKARHKQRGDLARACREAVKGSKWRSSQGVLFDQRNGWFLAVHEMTNILHEETKARLVVKPMSVDPIFWDLVGEPQLRSQPLSFRYFGAVTCPGLILGEPEISEEGGVAAIALRMVELGENALSEVAAEWTTDEFLGCIAASINPARLFATTIATLIASDRLDEALRLTDKASTRAIGGFLSKRGSFPETASAWIRQRLQVE